MHKMNVLMDKLDSLVSGPDRALLIVSDNAFLKKQVEAFIQANGKAYRWFNGDIHEVAFHELLQGKDILVFDGLNYNKRAISGLLYKATIDPIGISVKIVFRGNISEFSGKIIIFGTDVIEIPAVRHCFDVWVDF